jgi:hypothetical protein
LPIIASATPYPIVASTSTTSCLKVIFILDLSKRTVLRTLHHQPRWHACHWRSGRRSA